MVDTMVDSRWKGVSPLTGRVGDAFAVRWTGSLVAPVTGTYKLGVNGSTGYTLYVNGTLLVEYQGVICPRTRTKAVDLVAGRFYSLRLDYVNRGLDPQAQLLWSIPRTDYLTEAVDVARKAEVVVMVMGLSPALEGEEMPVQVEGFAGGDRIDIGLPGPQEELLKRIHALGKPMVLVLLNGSAVAVNWAAEHVPAILEAWYPGQAGGDAIADVLFGDYDPSGRLPVTFYKSVEDLPPFEDYRMQGRTYRYFPGEPLFPFGHGLSYTTFAYSNLQLSSKTISPGDTLTVSVDVQNVGKRAGDEVVQLYVSDVVASVPVPIRQLQGFERIQLVSGEKKTVTFALSPRQLSLIDDEGQRVIEPGEFRITIGGRQPDTRDSAGEARGLLVGSFGVSGEGEAVAMSEVL